MSGDERTRFCELCQLHVYNISELSRSEAESLIERTEGRICARIYRRTDGTVLTKDCPVGLRAFRRRISRIAGAACTALLSLAASALGQTWTRTSRDESNAPQVKVTRTIVGLNPQQGRATLWGVITDPNGEPLADARATIINELTKHKRTVKSDKQGQFKLGLLEPGSYTIKIEADGFAPYSRDHLSLHSNEELRLDVNLNLASATVGVIVFDDPPGKGIIIDGVRVSINEK